MSKYRAAIRTNAPERLPELAPQCGQWINCEGSRGRYVGVTDQGTIYIAWANSATKRFPEFVKAYKRNRKGLAHNEAA